MARPPEELTRAKTITDLEWPLLLDRIAAYASTSAGAARLRATQPEPALELARRRFELTRSALELSAEGTPVPSGDVPDLRELLERLARGADASAVELRDLGRMLETARKLRQWCAARRDAHPALAETLGSDPELDRLAAEIERSIEPDASVSDRASPALRDARAKLTTLRKTMAARLGQLIRRYHDVLSGDYHAERDGRYVLPVRADAHVKVQGIVLGASASGATLYVEPQEVTSLGNELKVAEGVVMREEARVVAALSALAAQHAESALGALEAAVEADVLVAIVRWAAEAGAVAIAPDDEPRLRLRTLRHPLLLGTGIKVVPNDVELRSGQALVISGPNAGGKTVVLKGLGLAAWMVRAGLPVPAAPDSSIGWFEPVMAEVGDDQSLVRSLSTFSAHIENLCAILELSGERALVLLDEVAAGTDPEEGSALAAAVLEALVARGAAVAVTTHYERLKELAADGGAFENASMGFDLERMEPTFRLRIGVPGPSSALAVARRHRMPSAVVERARELLPATSIDREQLVRQLQAEVAALELARRTAEAEAETQKELTRKLQAEQVEIAERERQRLLAEARELGADVRRARAEIRESLAKLRRAEPGIAAVREAERSVDDAARQIAVGSELARVARAPSAGAGRRPVEAGELAVGARVWLKRLGVSAEVIECLADGQVRLLAGALKLVASPSELEIDPHAAPRPASPPRRAKSAPRAVADGFIPLRTTDNTLDLRGQRVEESLERVDAFIDRMMSAGERAAFVLHGHGTGALKSAVREHLKSSRYVARAEPAAPDDGGDAFTVFWLQD